MSLKSSVAILALCSGLALSTGTGCKKPVQAKIPTPVPSPTPLPNKDVIAFTRSGQLWVMKTDGTGQAPLIARRDASIWFPFASPKGSDFIAWMSRNDGTQDVVRITLDGKITQLTSIDEHAKAVMKNLRLSNAPAYDSKALRIAYSFNGAIWIMDRDGDNSETLISDGNSYAPVWSPDDKKIAYLNGKNGHFDLWVTDVSSHDTYQVTDFQDYSAGQPRWVAGGLRIMMTRSQKDQSDIVDVLASTDQPLVDADVITQDHLSASAISDPDAKHLLYSSAAANPPQWDIWIADATGKEGKPLTTQGGVSPAWLRPSNDVSMPMAAAMPVPTLVPVPTALPVVAQQAKPAPAAPVVPSGAPQAAKPLQPAAPAATAPAAMAAAKPNASVPASKPVVQAPRPNPSGIASTPVPKPAAQKPAPTQPPTKAPPLRLRLKASFDPESDELEPGSMAELQKMSSRVRQYAGETIQIYGPLDRSPLKGQYASSDERSQARATVVATQLAKQAGLAASAVQAFPYTPVSLGSQVFNGIQIYIVIK